MNNEREYFFCYSTNLYEFIRKEKGLKYICTAIHHKTKKRFWLFKRTDDLNNALKEYTERGEQLGLRNKE